MSLRNLHLTGIGLSVSPVRKYGDTTRTDLCPTGTSPRVLVSLHQEKGTPVKDLFRVVDLLSHGVRLPLRPPREVVRDVWRPSDLLHTLGTSTHRSSDNPHMTLSGTTSTTSGLDFIVATPTSVILTPLFSHPSQIPVQGDCVTKSCLPPSNGDPM